MRRCQLLAAVLLVTSLASPLAARRQGPDGDVFALLRAIDDAAARQAWPGFRLSDWPIAVYDGTRTLLLRHPAPPQEFRPLDGHPGVLAAAGRYPAVMSNSTIDLAGTRTATIVATPGPNRESTLLAYAEEVFHVFWLRRHTNFRPNEMARYGYPMKDARNLRLVLAEDEALARALEAPDSTRAASWAATMIQARREREPLLTPDDHTFETGLEMMEGTANAVARVVVGLAPSETARRLRADRPADQLRWRYYDSGAAICLLLDRLEDTASQPARRAQPAEPLPAARGVGWKTRIDAEPTTTTLALLEEAVTRAAARPNAFAAAEWARFEERAAAAIAELSARQAKTRDDLQARAGARIVVEIAAGREGLRAARFDPVNLLVLDAGEMVHPRYLTLSGSAGTIEVTNPGYARGSFGGTVAITRPAGRHPLAEGVRSVTIVGVRGAPQVASRDGRVTVEFEGGRIALDGAEARTEGETIRVTVGRPQPPSYGF
jgi:hypothetical protein